MGAGKSFSFFVKGVQNCVRFRCTSLHSYSVLHSNDPFNTANWFYDETADRFVCPNGQDVTFRYMSERTDHYGFTRDFKLYESEGCDGCPLRSRCTKAAEGRHRQVHINTSWEEQKEQMKKWLIQSVARRAA